MNGISNMYYRSSNCNLEGKMTNSEDIAKAMVKISEIMMSTNSLLNQHNQMLLDLYERLSKLEKKIVED